QSFIGKYATFVDMKDIDKDGVSEIVTETIISGIEKVDDKGIVNASYKFINNKWKLLNFTVADRQ
ncbi:MAG: hypothetical protein RR838_12215, partial [Clostridium sp.]